MSTRLQSTCVLLALLTVFCGGGCLTPHAPLRVAVNPWPGYAFLFLADELGYYKEEGVDVKLLEFTSLGDVRRTFELGSVDVMSCTLIELLMVAHHTDRDPHVVLVADYSNGADMLFAESSISDIDELVGARVGVEPGTLDVVNLYAALQHRGLDLSDVKAVPMTQAEIPAAFAEHRIEAAWCYPPTSTRLASNANLNCLFDSSQIPRTIVDVIAASGACLEHRPEDLKGLYRAYFRAVGYYRDNPEKAIACMARRTGATPDELAESLAGIVLISQDEQRSFLEPGGDLDRATAVTQEAMTASRMVPGRLKPVRLRQLSQGEGVQ